MKKHILLGMFYYNGDGVTCDSTKGIDWLQRAAYNGSGGAADFCKRKNIYVPK